MTELHRQIQHVFHFWGAVEALTPQKLDKANPEDKQKPAYAIEPDGVLPWNDPKHTCKAIPSGKVWRYTIQCGIYDISGLSGLLEDKIGGNNDIVENRPEGQSRLFDISCNEHGIPQFGSFMLSLASWSAGQILHHEQGIAALTNSITPDLSDLPVPDSFIPFINSGFSDFDTVNRHLMQWVANEAKRLESEEGKCDLTWIINLTERVIRLIYFPCSVIIQPFACLVKCVLVKDPKIKALPLKTPDAHPGNTSVRDKTSSPVAIPDDMLNSFFIQELRQLGVAWQNKEYGSGFAEYLCAISEPERKRTDVRSPEGLDLAFEKLLPAQFPEGSWPSDYPLAFSQQLAVNAIWHHHSDNAGIFAVNGPPGTGKTTLLRDVVAAVVTRRASQLINLSDNVFAAKESIRSGNDRIPYYPLHETIKGSAIVVASANNGAVENISLELPGKNAVPEDVPVKHDYFSGLVPELINKPGWGLLAARLGNRANRERFMNIFWWNQPKTDEKDAFPPPPVFTPHLGEGLAYHLRLIKKG